MSTVQPPPSSQNRNQGQSYQFKQIKQNDGQGHFWENLSDITSKMSKLQKGIAIATSVIWVPLGLAFSLVSGFYLPYLVYKRINAHQIQPNASLPNNNFPAITSSSPNRVEGEQQHKPISVTINRGPLPQTSAAPAASVYPPASAHAAGPSQTIDPIKNFLLNKVSEASVWRELLIIYNKDKDFPNFLRARNFDPSTANENRALEILLDHYVHVEEDKLTNVSYALATNKEAAVALLQKSPDTQVFYKTKSGKMVIMIAAKGPDGTPLSYKISPITPTSEPLVAWIATALTNVHKKKDVSHFKEQSHPSQRPFAPPSTAPVNPQNPTHLSSVTEPFPQYLWPSSEIRKEFNKEYLNPEFRLFLAGKNILPGRNYSGAVLEGALAEYQQQNQQIPFMQRDLKNVPAAVGIFNLQQFQISIDRMFQQYEQLESDRNIISLFRIAALGGLAQDDIQYDPKKFQLFLHQQGINPSIIGSYDSGLLYTLLQKFKSSNRAEYDQVKLILRRGNQAAFISKVQKLQSGNLTPQNKEKLNQIITSLQITPPGHTSAFYRFLESRNYDMQIPEIFTLAREWDVFQRDSSLLALQGQNIENFLQSLTLGPQPLAAASPALQQAILAPGPTPQQPQQQIFPQHPQNVEAIQQPQAPPQPIPTPQKLGGAPPLAAALPRASGVRTPGNTYASANPTKPVSENLGQFKARIMANYQDHERYGVMVRVLCQQLLYNDEFVHSLDDQYFDWTQEIANPEECLRKLANITNNFLKAKGFDPIPTDEIDIALTPQIKKRELEKCKQDNFVFCKPRDLPSEHSYDRYAKEWLSEGPVAQLILNAKSNGSLHGIPCLLTCASTVNLEEDSDYLLKAMNTFHPAELAKGFMMPIQTGGNHFVLAYLNPKTQTIDFFDSQGKPPSRVVQANLERVAQNMKPPYRIRQMIGDNCPCKRLQHDGFQCGCWMIKMMLLVAKFQNEGKDIATELAKYNSMSQDAIDKEIEDFRQKSQDDVIKKRMRPPIIQEKADAYLKNPRFPQRRPRVQS